MIVEKTFILFTGASDCSFMLLKPGILNWAIPRISLFDNVIFPLERKFSIVSVAL